MGDKVDQTMGGHGCWTEGFVLHFVLDVGNPGRVSEQRSSGADVLAGYHYIPGILLCVLGASLGSSWGPHTLYLFLK